MDTRAPRDARSVAHLILVGIGTVLIGACGFLDRPRPEPVPNLVTAHFRDRAEPQRTMVRAASGDTAERVGVRADVDEHAILLSGGTPGLVYVNAGHYAGGDYFDTLVVRRADLAPVWEHINYPQRRIEKSIQFHGASLDQRNRVGDSTRAFALRFSRPVLAFSEVDLVVRSLPYAAGYHSILPLYSEGDDSLELDTIAVVGAPGRRVTLRFADPVLIVTYVVDSVTRRLVSYEAINKRTGGRARRAVG